MLIISIIEILLAHLSIFSNFIKIRSSTENQKIYNYAKAFKIHDVFLSTHFSRLGLTPVYWLKIPKASPNHTRIYLACLTSK